MNTSGRLAAMYSYSKTRGLFGGVSVEGTIIVARQDANRLAYGGKPTIKQVLGGAFDWPPWASVLIREIEKCTGTGARPGEWGIQDEDGEGGGMGWDNPMDRDRKGSGSGGYVFGEGMGSDGSAPPNGRKRSGSLFGAGEKGDKEKEKGSPRPNGARRTSSLNPLSSGTASPRKAGLPSSSSESYNAGLTWDSDGPMNGYGNRSRSGSNPNRLTNGDASRKFAVPFDSDYEELSYRAAGDDEDDLLGRKSNGNGRANGHGDIDGKDDLLRTWDADSKGLSKSFSSMSTGAKMNGGRIRSNSRPQPFQDIDENEGSPFEVRSSFSNGDPASHSKLAKGRVNVDKKGFTNGAPTSPFGDDDDNSHRQYDDFGSPQSRQNRRETTSPKPNIPLKAGLGSADDGYARAVAQYEFKATASGDLGMKSGQVVVILDTVGNGEWWRGRSGDGKEGIFPSNYVEVLEIPKTLKGGVGRGELKGRMARLPFD